MEADRLPGVPYSAWQYTATAGEIHRALPVADLHVHPMMPYELFGYSIGSLIPRTGLLHKQQASFAQMNEGNYSLALATLYVPELDLLEDFWPLKYMVRVGRLLSKAIRAKVDPSPNRVARHMLVNLKRSARESLQRIEVVTNVTRLRQLKSSVASPSRPLVPVPAFEGGHVLDVDANNPSQVLWRLERLFHLGVASLTLVHFFNVGLVQPVHPYPHNIGGLARLFKTYRQDVYRDVSIGLSSLGKDVVCRMAELGMLIDMSHCTPVARRQIYDIVNSGGRKGTLIMTHVGSFQRNPSPYNPEDWEVRRIADTGGMVGVIFMNYWLVPAETSRSLDAIAQTVKHFLSVAPHTAVGFGSDFDGFATPPEDLASAPFLERLTRRLMAEGLSEAVLRAVMGGNLWDVLCSRWGRMT